MNKMGSLRTALDESISDQLKARGLQSPLYDLKNDLLGHPELIPLKGTYGGKMSFIGDYFFVISNHWALVSFSDGYLGGYMLLRYQVNKGKIKWKVLDVDLD